jgi:hypothetical protein
MVNGVVHGRNLSGGYGGQGQKNRKFPFKFTKMKQYLSVSGFKPLWLIHFKRESRLSSGLNVTKKSIVGQSRTVNLQAAGTDGSDDFTNAFTIPISSTY